MPFPPDLPAEILDGADRSDRLVGWKDISAYVGKAQRTVQRWEKDYQLPVHRLGREGGEIVFAFRAEIDTWLRGHDAVRARQSNGDGAHAADDPTPAGAPTLEGDRAASAAVVTRVPSSALSPAKRTRRWSGWRVALGTLALVVAGGAGWWIVGRAVRASLPVSPADWQVRGSALSVVDAQGRLLWQKTFSPLETAAYERDLGSAAPPPVQIADLDGDGVSEVLFKRLAGPRSLRKFHVFEADGRERFVRDVRATLQYGDVTYSSPWPALHVFLTPQPGGASALWLVSTHGTDFPTLVEELAADGAPRSAYWSNGFVATLVETRLAGRDVILVGATNNDTRGASVAMFDRRDVNGSAPAANPHYRCGNCPAGEPLAFFVFPRLCPAVSAGRQATTREILVDEAGQITVIVEQSEPHPESAPVYYRFDSAWRLLAVDVHPAYEVLHRQLQHEGVLDHAYGPAEAELASHVRRWNGSGFLAVEKAPSFNTPQTEPTPFFGPLVERPPGG
jgi:hypothetical protein